MLQIENLNEIVYRSIEVHKLKEVSLILLKRLQGPRGSLLLLILKMTSMELIFNTRQETQFI